MNWSFVNDLKRGLGNTYVQISECPNKNQYRDELLYACLHDIADNFVCEGSKGDYLYELVCLLPDKEYFRDKVAEYLMSSVLHKSSFLAQMLDFLACFAYDGDKVAKQTIKDFYQQYISKGKWTSNKIGGYDYLCIKMCQLFGIKKVLQILDDIPKLPITLYNVGWFVGSIKRRYKNNAKIQSIAEEEYVRSYPERDHTFVEFLSITKQNDVPYCFADWATEEEFQKRVDFLQQCDDVDLVCKILEDGFQDVVTQKQLDVKLLLQLKDKFGSAIEEHVYATLGYITSPMVLQIGLDLVENNKYLDHAIHMLMTNYNSSLRYVLSNAYNKVKFSFRCYHPLIYWTTDFMNTTKKHLPDEILFIAYNKSYSAFSREFVIDCMYKRKLLSRDFVEELKHDSDYDIRKKAYKWAKKMYSQD